MVWYGTVLGPGDGTQHKYYLFSLRALAAFSAKGCKGFAGKTTRAPPPVAPAGVVPVVRPLLGVAKVGGCARPGEATIAGKIRTFEISHSQLVLRPVL